MKGKHVAISANTIHSSSVKQAQTPPWLISHCPGISLRPYITVRLLSIIPRRPGRIPVNGVARQDTDNWYTSDDALKLVFDGQVA